MAYPSTWTTPTNNTFQNVINVNGNPYNQLGLVCEWEYRQDPINLKTQIRLKTYVRFVSIDVGARSDSSQTIGTTTTVTVPAINKTYSEATNHLVYTGTGEISHNASTGKAGNISLGFYWPCRLTNYSNHSYDSFTTSTTVTVPDLEVGNIQIYANNKWNKGQLHYYNGTDWKKATLYYYNGTDWKQCKV